MCAGAVHTPHLLQLSGIGNGETLRHHEVKVRADLPGVGQNLQASLPNLIFWHVIPAPEACAGIAF